MRSLAAMQKASAFTVTRKRRSFGLDAPRPPDVRRTEADILAWLAAHAPGILTLRAEPPRSATPANDPSATLVLLLPGGGIALLRIEAARDRIGSGTMALAEHCRARRIPLSLVADVEETRAALRRLGIEPEEA